MGMSRLDYAELIKGLLPKGDAWARGVTGTFQKLCEAMAEEIVRLDERARVDLINEADPRSALEMLPDWERVVGIPDGVIPAETNLQKRRQQVQTKLANIGGQSRAFFIELAALLGFTVTITEFRPFRAGMSRSGDPVYNVEWAHVWRVNAPGNTITYFRAGQSRAGEPLAEWGNDVLEAVINRAKPAHTIVLFGYT